MSVCVYACMHASVCTCIHTFVCVHEDVCRVVSFGIQCYTWTNVMLNSGRYIQLCCENIRSPTCMHASAEGLKRRACPWPVPAAAAIVLLEKKYYSIKVLQHSAS
jgi:hypothetical protein